jgi:hypothetical protein
MRIKLPGAVAIAKELLSRRLRKPHRHTTPVRDIQVASAFEWNERERRSVLI